MCCLSIVSLGTSGYFLKYDSKISKLDSVVVELLLILRTPFDLTFSGRDSRGALSHCYFKSAWATLAAGSRTLSSFSSD